EYIAHDARPERLPKSRDCENSFSKTSDPSAETEINLMQSELKDSEPSASVMSEITKSGERSCAFPPINSVSAETESTTTEDDKTKEEGEIASKSEPDPPKETEV